MIMKFEIELKYKKILEILFLKHQNDFLKLIFEYPRFKALS